MPDEALSPNLYTSKYLPLSIADFGAETEGDYTVVVTNSRGSVTSNVATLLLVTPPELQAHVDAVARAIVAKHGFVEHRSYVAQVGRGEQIELFFVVREDDPPRPLLEWDHLRDEIGDALGESSPDRWLTIMFTTDREWTI